MATRSRWYILCWPLLATLAGGPVIAAEWLEDPITGCALWADDADPEHEVASWTGPCEDGRAVGEGVLSWFEDGQLLGRYEGMMHAGKMDGHGVLHYRTSAGFDRFEGDFRDGEPHGHVVYLRAKGDRFEGDMVAGEIAGSGVHTAANGDRYEGTFDQGLADGEGELRRADGARYTGSFRAGKPNGDGVFEAADGSRFEGRFRNGKPFGTGRYVAPDGTVHEAEVRDGFIDDSTLLVIVAPTSQ